MEGLRSLTAVILAGGLGTRLRPVLGDRQKVLAEVRGRPFLEVLLDQLIKAQVRYVVLCTGYQGDQVMAALGHRYRDVELSYSHESTPLGTAGALATALPLIRSETVLVMNGDSYCDSDLDAFLKFHRSRRAGVSVLLVEQCDTSRYGRVAFDSNNLLTRLEEKGASARPGWINAGIYLIERDLLTTVPETRPLSLEREVLPAWTRDKKFFAFPSGGRFLDIGTPDAYQSAETFFENRMGMR